MKILLFGEYTTGVVCTGPENYALHLFRSLVKKNADVTFLSYFHDGRKYSIVRKLFGYTASRNEGGGTIIRAGIIPMLFVLMTHHFDIVHIVTFERSALLLLWSRLVRPFRLIYTEHGLLAFEYARYRRNIQRVYARSALLIERRILAAADMVIFVSNLQERLHSSLLPEPLSSAVIPPGIDEQFLQLQREEHQPVRLLFVGGPSRPEKGWDTLLKVLESLKMPADITIVCDERTVIPTGTLKIGVRTVKKVHGQEYAALLKNHDIFLSLSHYDSFSITAAEAMAAGLVPVVTRTTGMSELIVHGESGFIVDDGSVDEVTEILHRCIRTPSLLASVAMRAKEGMRANRWDEVSSTHLSLYERMYHGS